LRTLSIEALSRAADLLPVIGDGKAFYEAESTADYAWATAGLIPVVKIVGKVTKATHKATKGAKNATPIALKSNENSENVKKALPKPSEPTFSLIVDTKQQGKKLGKHVQDFGGNPANPADREMVMNKIYDIAQNPDRIVRGTFSWQGISGVRGEVIFRVNNNDVVTKENGEFITILKDGVTQNPSVKSALNAKK